MKKVGLTTFHLKCIAVVSMTFDHAGAVLFQEAVWMRCLGRLAFPIFCFLIVEGFVHTHDVYGYLRRLGVFALVSEIPFDLAFYGETIELRHQNVFFTLFLGVLMLALMEKCREWPEKAAVILIIMWLSALVKCDYSFRGVILISVFYIFRSYRSIILAGGVLWNFLYTGAVQKAGILAMIPIMMYNGSLGKKVKYFFYFFYPVHLLVIYGIKLWCVN